MVLSRREFIKSVGIAVFGGKVLYDSIGDLNKFLKKDRIYNELPNYVKKIRSVRTYRIEEEERAQDSFGSAFRVNDELFTCYHNIKDSPYMVNTNFGLFPMNSAKLKEKKLTVDGIETKVINYNEEMDSAICEVTDEIDKILKPLPCDYGKVSKGDQVYMIGNPNVGGVFVKSGLVGRLKSFTSRDGTEDKMTKGSFAIGMPAIPGDSGSPIINDDFELVGVAHASGDGVRAIATYIEHYINLLKKSSQLNNRRFRNG